MTDLSEHSGPSAGLLCDTAGRDYSSKLRLFNAYAAREIRQAIAFLNLRPGMSVLDAGCGTGEALRWLHEAVRPTGSVLGIDLARAHITGARIDLPPRVTALQGDLLDPLVESASLDAVWTVNTVNHLRDPSAGLAVLAALLRPGGRLAAAQSSFLPEMFFAWNSRLEREVNEAVRAYYRERYHLEESELASVRSLVGMLRAAGLRNVAAKTFPIERISPLDSDTAAYLEQAIFRDTWGERLRPYLSNRDFAELSDYCNPHHAGFALRREEFHFLQTFTLVVGDR